MFLSEAVVSVTSKVSLEEAYLELTEAALSLQELANAGVQAQFHIKTALTESEEVSKKEDGLIVRMAKKVKEIIVAIKNAIVKFFRAMGRRILSFYNWLIGKAKKNEADAKAAESEAGGDKTVTNVPVVVPSSNQASDVAAKTDVAPFVHSGDFLGPETPEFNNARLDRGTTTIDGEFERGATTFISSPSPKSTALAVTKRNAVYDAKPQDASVRVAKSALRTLESLSKILVNAFDTINKKGTVNSIMKDMAKLAVIFERAKAKGDSEIAKEYTRGAFQDVRISELNAIKRMAEQSDSYANAGEKSLAQEIKDAEEVSRLTNPTDAQREKAKSVLKHAEDATRAWRQFASMTAAFVGCTVNYLKG